MSGVELMIALAVLAWMVKRGRRHPHPIDDALNEWLIVLEIRDAKARTPHEQSKDEP